MDYKKTSVAYKRLRILRKPWAGRILSKLHQDGAMDQTEIWIFLRENTQSKVAWYMSELKLAGVINATREGKHMIYTLNYEGVTRINQALNQFSDIKRKAE